jgi:hypothetical protein
MCKLLLIRESRAVEDMVLYGSRVRVDRLSVAELMEDVYHHSSCIYIIDTEFCRSKRLGQTVFAESRF